MIYTESEVRNELTRQCADNKKAYAEKIGVSRTYLYEVLNGTRRMSDKIAEMLGFTRVQRPVPVERIYEMKNKSENVSQQG